MKSPAPDRTLYRRGQIHLADCIVLGGCDERMTGQNEKARRLAGLWPADNFQRRVIFFNCFRLVSALVRDAEHIKPASCFDVSKPAFGFIR